MTDKPPITLTDPDGHTRPWQSLADVGNLVQVLTQAIGDGAVVIIMIGKNDHPHSRHHVSWTASGSCMEVRGLLAQCTDIMERHFDGNKKHPDDLPPPVPSTIGRGGGPTTVASGGNGAGGGMLPDGTYVGGGGGASSTMPSGGEGWGSSHSAGPRGLGGGGDGGASEAPGVHCLAVREGHVERVQAARCRWPKHRAD